MWAPDWFGGGTSPDAAAWSAVLLSPAIGSFLGVVIRRLPEGRPIVWARSKCESCGTALGIRELVPVLGWLSQRGRCRFCTARIGWFYPAVELAALAIAIIAAIVDSGTEAWLDCILGWWLLALGWIDARHWLLPDALTLPLAAAGFIAALAVDPEGLPDRTLGLLVGYFVLRAVAFLYRKMRGREGLGAGDAKLLAAAGAWVGASGLPLVVLIAALSGLLAAACLRLAGVRLSAASAIPFGPFLAFAIWLVWLLPAL
jgi:leader peptidase (prepilin peptidase) / N-methyltransferase